MKQEKHQDSKPVKTTELVSGDIKTSSKEEEGKKSEHQRSGKSQKSLFCSMPGCDFISYGVDEAHKKDHFLISHSNSELIENPFIVINSAMAEAILQEIKKENN